MSQRRPAGVFLFLTAGPALLLCFLTSCSSQASAPVSAEAANIALPPSLAIGSLQFQQILELKEELSAEQLQFALKMFLKQWGINSTDKQEASYLLGRLLQSSSKPDDLQEALSAFQISKELDSLRNVSLWHASEVAQALGKEKVVRDFLNQIRKSSAEEDVIARADYGLAQSYLRASETDRAQEAFASIQKQYPGSAYAIGANYYLGEIAWAKAMAQPNNQSQDISSQINRTPDAQLPDTPSGLQNGGKSDNDAVDNSTRGNALRAQVSDAQALQTAIGLFTQYLKLSPTGHFSDIARARLAQVKNQMPAKLTASELDALAMSYYANNQWEPALAIWSERKPIDRLVEIALCQAHSRQVAQARLTLLQAVKSPANKGKYAAVGKYLSLSLSKEEATKFWQQILKNLPAQKDTALWNIAIRLSPPLSLPYFKQITKDYPGSPYAAESNWWLFWDEVQHKSGKALLPLVHRADALARNYKISRAAPRLLFWAGKIAERAGDSKTASVEYKKVQQFYSADYYAFRAAERLAQLQKRTLPFGWVRKYGGSLPAAWTLPDPLQLKTQGSGGLNETVRELIKLKEFEEPLQLLPAGDNEMKAWLLAKLHQPMQSVATASKQLSEAPLSAAVWQYSYPLLYARDIEANCAAFTNVDPVLMHALVREESHYDPNAISSSKAIGLTQVMPGTAYGVAKTLNIPVKNLSEFFAPSLNLKLGTKYFSYSLSRFQNNALYAVAAYNGGAGAVKSWIAVQHHKGDDDFDAFVENIPFRETRDYVRKVFGSYWNYLRVYGSARI